MEVLAGKSKGDPGLIQTAAVKHRIALWFLQYVSGNISPASGGTVTAEGFRQLQEAFASLLTFYQTFARTRSVAEEEACTLKCLVGEQLEIFPNALT